MNKKIIKQKNININVIKKEPLEVYILKIIAPSHKNDIADPFHASFFSYPFQPTCKFSIESFYLSAFYYKNFMEIYKELDENVFINEKQKSYLKKIFFKLKFILRNLNLFSRKIIYRNNYRITLHDHNEDLKLISLDSYHPRFIMEITENNTIYKFVIFDLLEIIRSSLTYTYALFCEPKKPKNPFTNLYLSDANLYNIYFFAKQLDITFCIIFHAYYKSNFNTETFLLDYEPIIRDNIIENFYKNCTESKKYKDCMEFIELYKRLMKGIVIHKDFPQKLLYEKLEPFLKMNLYIQYTYSPSKRIYYRKLLSKSLKQFVKENPMFGRIIIKPKIKTTFKFLNTIDESRTLSQTIIQNQPINQNYIIRNYDNVSNDIHDYAEDVLQEESREAVETAADAIANAISSTNAISNESTDDEVYDYDDNDNDDDNDDDDDELSGDEVLDDDPPVLPDLDENIVEYDSS